MEAAARGTITSLETLFPPDEAQKAARRVEEAIADRRNELLRVQGFVSDNSSLINLVRTLPEELSHDIMVLLGEGYYAERTAKQTMEILQRRGKALEGQVESLKATMVDLEAEAKFFDSTAAEAAEGLVEIREEYVEESEKKAPGSDSLDSKRDDMQMPDEDEEYARIMARLDELEKEELEDGSTSDDDNEENLAGDEVEDDETGDEDEDAESSSSFSTSDLKHEILEIKHKSEHPVQKARGQGQEMLGSIVSKQIGGITEQPLTDQPFSGDSKMQFPAVAHSFSNSGQSISKEVSRSSSSDAKFSFSKIEDSSNSTSRQISDRVSSGHKAFTGSIIEHDLGLPPIQSAKSNLGQASVSSSSKPVSRFKMQKGNR
ncbi:uncharacterized protein LOC103980466 isoform X2 [Musa acuminata AAA Group]|uniref:Uncharacterized protein n=1 Tax=Musa acuminata subsp. malaccensis TaxID=214687 RepID=A0A804IJA6_MUSAM|nr:PREDICTED: RNA polymerase II subunit 5-mediating protein homolog isoform X2 [Musa acuminata subsp. malaccensis]